jgi:hypothetical protein
MPLPAWFEPSSGGAFVARSGWHKLRLDPAGALIETPEGGRVRLSLRGARAVRPEGLDPQPGRSHHFRGSDRSQWRHGVPQFARVRQSSVYPGIDLVYYPNGRELEYDFLVAPGADPSRIRFSYDGARSLRLAADGSLLVQTSAGEIRQLAPRLYQDLEENGLARRVEVSGRYRLFPGRQAGFEIARYDRRRPLVIDPVLTYSGYFGSAGYDAIQAIASDRQGGFWAAGVTSSSINLPESQKIAPKFSNNQGAKDVFLARFTPNASGVLTLVYMGYFGGALDDQPAALAVGPGGRVYLTGVTTSSDWPVSAIAPQREYGQDGDAFVLAVEPASDGDDSLIFSTYFGKANKEIPQAIAVRPNGNILIAGYTSAGELPGISNSYFQQSNRGGWDGFLAEFNPNTAAGSMITFASFFGGDGADYINAIGLTPTGRVVLSGLTTSTDLPLAGVSYMPSLSGGGDAFLAVFDLSLPKFDALLYSTYLGGSAIDSARAMAVAADGTVWLAGYTLSDDFPVTPGAAQGGNNGNADAFLAHLDPQAGPGQFLRYSTYLGGGDTDVAYALAPISATEVAIAGYTMSGGFPQTGGVLPVSASGPSADIFVAAIDTARPGPAGLAWSGVVPGRVLDVATCLASDAAGNLVLGGYSTSPNLHSTGGDPKPSANGFASGFLLRIAR